MKLGKLSLIAALAMTTGAFASDATDSMKFEGQLKAWYQTMDHGGMSNGQADKGLFQRDPNQFNEWGNVEAQLSVSGNANDHLKYKVTAMTVTTFGLENQVVSFQTARPGQFGASNGENAQPFWVHEAYLDYSLTKSTNIKAGRMELDTPFAFTEKWNATANAFEAVVAVNTDVPDTTLVAAWVSKGNGATDNLVYAPQVFGAESRFSNYMGFKHDGNQIATGGALVVGAINKSLGMPIQVWGYEIPSVGQAYWIQADASLKDLGPVNSLSGQLIGAGIGTKGATQAYLNNITNTKDTTAVAAKVGASVGIFNVMAAFSQTSEGNLPVANTATNFKKTKLPTQLIFNDGMVVAQPDTTAWKVAADAKFNGIGKFTVAYGSAKVGENAGYLNPNAPVGGPASFGHIAQNFLNDDVTVNEFDFVYNTKVADVDLAMMYIKVNKTYVPRLGNAAAFGGFQDGVGTFSNDIVRVVATLKF